MSIVGGGEGGGANRNVDLEFSFGRNFIHTECDWFLFIDIYFRLFLFSVVSLFLLFGVVISLMLYNLTRKTPGSAFIELPFWYPFKKDNRSVRSSVFDGRNVDIPKT